MKLKLAIAPWGDPSSWRESEYEVELEDNREGVNKTEERKRDITSLKVLQDQVGFDKAFILVQDSALFTSVKERYPINDVSKECGKLVGAYHDLSEGGVQREVIWPKGEIKDYNELVEKTRNYVNCIAEKRGIRGAEVIVVPSKIRVTLKGVKDDSPFPYTRFESDAKVYFIYSVGLIGLLERTLNYVGSIKEIKEMEIVVDTTHGLNYFAALSVTLARDFASLVSMRNGSPVKVTYYSSVPAHENGYKLAMVGVETSPRLRGLDPQELTGYGKAVYYSLIYNSPLALVYSAMNYRPAEVGLSSIYGTVRLTKEGKTLKVDYNLQKQEVEKEDESYIYSVVKIVKDLCGDSCGEWVYHHFLRELGKRVYRLMSRASEQIVQHELWVVQKTVTDALNKGYMKEGEEKQYSQIYGVSLQAGQGTNASSNLKRNVIAHAGLIKDYVKVKAIRDNGGLKIFLAYTDWEGLRKKVFS